MGNSSGFQEGYQPLVANAASFPQIPLFTVTPNPVALASAFTPNARGPSLGLSWQTLLPCCGAEHSS